MNTEMNDQLRELMMDVLSGEASEGRRAEWQALLDADPALRARFEAQQATWNALSRLEAAMPTESTERHLEKQVLSAVQNELGKAAAPEVRTADRKASGPAVRTPSRRLTFILEAAAVVLAAVLACSAWIAYHNPKNTTQKEELPKKDLATPLDAKVLLALNDPEDPWKAEIRKRLSRHVSFEFVDTPLEEAIAFLDSLTKVNFILDPKASAKGDGKIPITLRVADMELETALAWILRLANMEYDLRNQAVFIFRPDPVMPKATAQAQSLPEAIQAKMSRKITLDFKDTPLDEAISFLRSLTNITIILDPKLQQAGTTGISLAVKDLPIGEVLKKILEKANAKSVWLDNALYITGTEIQPGEVPKQNLGSIHLYAAPQWPEKIKTVFDRKVTFEFVDSPLDETLKFISSLTGVSIEEDPVVSKNGQPRINLRVTNMSAGLALEWIMKLADARSYVKDGKIVVAARLLELNESLPKQSSLEDRLAALAILETPRLTRKALLEVIARDAGIDLDLSALPPELAGEAVNAPSEEVPVARFLARAVLHANPVLVVERKGAKLFVRPAGAGETPTVDVQDAPAAKSVSQKPAPPPQEDF
ncbi:MAG: hypothetical protein HY291_05290 [Planctomycetes bacterium]|nr:hypothetical protein [Planctomycetota bacterium]